MKGNCEKCELPKIKAEIEAQKNAALIANSNIKASTSPTEAGQFIKAAQDAVVELRVAHVELSAFLDVWRGTCDNCEYGA